MTQSHHAALAALDSYIRKKVRREALPGIIVGVTDAKRTLWHRTYGFSNLDAKTPAKEDTLFQIGSIGKSFASIALLELAERGKVDLNKPVKRYLPWLEIRSKHRPITLHHLLSHTGGIIAGPEKTLEARSEIWGLRELEATAQPGEMFHYSNIGYKIVGEVLSAVERKSCPRVLLERVIRPLGMALTATEITNDLRGRTAVGYWPLHDDVPTRPDPEWVPCTWIESDAADGSISSTALDMCSYVRMFLNRGRGPDGRVLSESAFRKMTQKVIRCDEGPRTEYYGYGLSVEPSRGHTLIGHTGGMLGFVSSIRLDLDEGVGAFASTNCSRTVDDITRLAVELLRRDRTHERLSGAELAVLPQRPDLREFEGTYTGVQHFLDIRKGGKGLRMRYGNELIDLEWRGGDSFYADHPPLDRYLFRFERDRGRVVELSHGSDWYSNARYKGKRGFPHHPEWDGLVGHYRTHSPWIRSFRIVLRKGSLIMTKQDEADEPLTQVARNVFRVGADSRSPERLWFEAFIDGRAHMAVLSGCEFARTFTP